LPEHSEDIGDCLRSEALGEQPVSNAFDVDGTQLVEPDRTDRGGDVAHGVAVPLSRRRRARSASRFEPLNVCTCCRRLLSGANLVRHNDPPDTWAPLGDVASHFGFSLLSFASSLDKRSLPRQYQALPSRAAWLSACRVVGIRVDGDLLRLKRVLSLGVILALVAGGCRSGGHLGPKDLSQQSEALQSEAAEGALLAQDAASGRTTRIYTREHSSDLSVAASQAEVMLKAASVDPALRSRLRRLALLAGLVSADLARLGSATRDQDRALARELELAAEASNRIGEALT
jgi:hypothetical protein